jgi:hypothetical protein
MIQECSAFCGPCSDIGSLDGFREYGMGAGELSFSLLDLMLLVAFV